MNRIAPTLLALIATAGIAHAQGGAPVAPIADSLDRFGLKILSKAVVDTGLATALRGKGPYTIFAPSSSAFIMLGKAKREALLADKKALKAVLLNHVVAGTYTAADLSKLKNNSTLKTLGGGVIHVKTKGTLLIESSRPVMPDQKVSNGVLHVMDRVLMPAGK
ncbi:MAG: fasciclin domain-containing protein [Armatimonadota bacterium]